ncbi:MAG: 50S ribosomal protein L35 [Bacilli bacterium]|nr:50S ribosomal protein L35 [Bacilli bacterium]MDD4608229.1 50S ribosomal protein L35 [Bacilli bacterium]
MPKLKTHKGTKKVLNIRPGGTISMGKPGSNHKTGKKNTAFSRKGRKDIQLSKSDLKRIKDLI